MKQNDALRCEIDRILEDPVFKRSPVQAQLLQYLCKRTSSENADKITQFDIASDGLGRSDYDESADSYVRVQVSRLKKSLSAYYARQLPGDEGCVYLRTGDYRLHMGTLKVAYPAQSKLRAVADLPIRAIETITKRDRTPQSLEQDEQKRSSLYKSPVFGAGAIFAFAMMLLLAALDKNPPPPALAPAPEHLTLPRVSFEVQTVGFGSTNADLVSLKSAALEEARDQLTKSIIASPIADSGLADLNLRLSLDTQTKKHWQVDIELTDAKGVSLYLNNRELPTDQDLAFAIIRQELITVTSPGGMITRNLGDRLSTAPRNDFECFVAIELGKTDGVPVSELLEHCLTRYRDSEFYPYFGARKLFAQFQNEALAGKPLSESSPHWEELASLLKEFPHNPYLNTIASKLLYASGRCDEAGVYAAEAFVRGTLFPALELAILSEKVGCGADQINTDQAAIRILEIIEANRNPHALLEIWEIAAALAIDRPDLAMRIPTDTFHADQPVERLSQSIISALRKRNDFQVPDLLQAMVWSPKARQNIQEAITSNAEGNCVYCRSFAAPSPTIANAAQ